MFYGCPWRIWKVFFFFAQVPVDRVVVGRFYFINAVYGENVLKIGIVQKGAAQVFGIVASTMPSEELFQVDGYDVGAMYQACSDKGGGRCRKEAVSVRVQTERNRPGNVFSRYCIMPAGSSVPAECACTFRRPGKVFIAGKRGERFVSFGFDFIVLVGINIHLHSRCFHNELSK